MNAAAIVYTSQTGFTARYAALLAERTGLPCRPLKEAMMAPMARLVSRAPAETEADRAMRDAFRDGGDWVSPERLAPVLAWLDGD